MSDGSPLALDKSSAPLSSMNIDGALIHQVTPEIGNFPWVRTATDRSASYANLDFNNYSFYGDTGSDNSKDLQAIFAAAASKVHFTTGASDAQSNVIPDYILGTDGKLQRNPAKKEPNKDGSVNIEVQSANKSEVAAKKAANDLQRAWAQDMIQRWQSSPDHQGEDVPQEWRDLVGKQDDSGPGQPDQPKPSPDQPPEPTPEQIPGPSQPQPQPSDSGSGGGGGTSGGGGGGYGGGDGGGSGGGGGGSPSGGGGGSDSSPAPRSDSGSNPPDSTPHGDVSLHDVPGPVPPGQALAHFQQAIDRANGGGEPVRVLQYGDSHIVAGTEPKTIEDALKAVAPTEYSTQAKVGISANYPLSDPQNWLDQPIAKANPDLVILSFGSNDSAGAVDKASYEATYQKLIDNIRERAPNASILIVAPPDGDSITGANTGHTLPGLDTVVEAQKEIAQKNGLDFFDLRQSMGGPGSVEDWHAKGLTADDKLHFSTQGYQLIGNSIADHLKNELHKK